MTPETIPGLPLKAKPRLPLLMLVPLAAFAALAGLFAVSLQRGDPTRVPSTLVGKPAPAFALAAVEGLQAGATPVPGFASGDLAMAGAKIVNVEEPEFANWSRLITNPAMSW